MVFDAGVKKICRHNQYFGVKTAREYVQRREGGIIWHTQGSGKSLTMVWLAKWIRELKGVDGRVLILTDRTELDEQIEKVFKGVDEDIYRTKSGADLAQVLQGTDESLICSLIHKFGSSEDGNVDRYVSKLKKHMSVGSRPSGEIFVFVDECHRTQSGKLHKAMKAILPGATLIGFTGTPLLKSDKQRSIETFGPYIHTYKYDEAVSDEVVLDLRYEARDIDQSITSEAKIDQWFDVKTKGLSDLARAQLRQKWGTMRKVTSSLDRIRKIVADILMDMEIKDRLKSGRGNAMLVCDSVYAACRFFEGFRDTLKDKCAIVTSYSPATGDIKGEETGEGPTEKLRKYRVYRKMLADYFDEPPDKAMHKAEQFEQEVKRRFVNDPGQMKLLIVVDKLLTGFDAPPATYLYIDKKMKDHGLFQAICRVNRLDGEDKEYGYIIDYKDLFRSLEGVIQDYTGEAFEGYDREDVEGLLKDRLKLGRERLEETHEAVKALCEPVEPPRDTEAFLRYFCHTGKGDTAGQLAANERKRLTLYRMVAAFLRAYANLANEMIEAGYTEAERLAIRDEVSYYEQVRQEVKLASGDYVDLKVFEPAMRLLLDTYIRAEDSEVISAFDDMTLVDLLIKEGEGAIGSLPEGIQGSQRAVAETIENNVRRLIVDEMAVNPKYYEKMSEVLDALIKQRREEAIEYEAYLKKVIELAEQVKSGEGGGSHPASIDNGALRAIYDNLPAQLAAAEPLRLVTGPARYVAEPGPAPNPDTTDDPREVAALAVDRAVRQTRMAGWRGHPIKERRIRKAIRDALGAYGEGEYPSTIFDIVKARSEY